MKYSRGAISKSDTLNEGFTGKQSKSLPSVPVLQSYCRNRKIIQCYPTIAEGDRKDSLIYGISAKGSGLPSYVGQTTIGRKAERWQEHVRNDDYAPWHYTKWNPAPDKIKTVEEAPYWWSSLEEPKNVTKVEITAAEQWWYEYYSKGGAKLLNPQTPMLKATFEKYTNPANYPGNYNPANVQIAKTWKPSK